MGGTRVWQAAYSKMRIHCYNSSHVCFSVTLASPVLINRKESCRTNRAWQVYQQDFSFTKTISVEEDGSGLTLLNFGLDGRFRLVYVFAEFFSIYYSDLGNKKYCNNLAWEAKRSIYDYTGTPPPPLIRAEQKLHY
jgi:hypothetical protein